MKIKNNQPRVYVQIYTCWGNGDACSIIKMSRHRWNAILNGAKYEKSTYSYYEGVRYLVTWEFEASKVSIYGEDGMECLLEHPVEELNSELIQ